MHKIEADRRIYQDLLQQYLLTGKQSYLEEAKAMSVSFVSRNIFPEEILRTHMKAIDSIFGEELAEYKRSLEFLFESLVAFRVAHEESEQLRREKWELKSEIQVAANMQKTLLRTSIPEISGIDIGAISVPYHQMNGDYFHFITGEDGTLGVAIADVIGKGVPAALSMSMIKYSMDSFYDELMSPSAILRNLNSVVERNVATNMFITMFYGQFFPNSGILRYASAGHEPGLIYRAETDEFEDIKAKGLVLGVLKNTHYNQYELTLNQDDMIILFTDGVTECRVDDRFITRKEVVELIRLYNHLPAQAQVKKVHEHIKKSEHLGLKDDFTIIIIKKRV